MVRSPTVDRVMVEERAAGFTKRSIKTSSKRAGLLLAMSMLDLTTLEGNDSPERVRALCRKAVTPMPGDDRVPGVAAVCVYPSLVRVARETLAGSGVRVASVATGFPSGQYPLEVRLEDVRRAVADGADEIDMVINRGAFLAGRLDEVAEEIRQVKLACGSAHLKVILETGELETLDNVRKASDLAIRAMDEVAGESRGLKSPAPQEGPAKAGGSALQDGPADFIKTSTGKVQPAATMPVTLVMLEAIRDWFFRTGKRVGMKPAGGIRTAKQALHYLVMVQETLGPEWLTPGRFRFGASALANDILRQLARLDRGVYMAGHDFTEG
jgi:deoxyribose-phosphate aldolase